MDSEDENFHEPLIENASTDLEAGEIRLLRGRKKSPLVMVSEYTQSERISNATTVCLSGLAIIAVLLNLSNMQVLAMGLTSLTVAPLVARNQKQLVDINALKKCGTVLREEVNNLAEDNERLKEQIEKMRRTAGRLEEVEGAFQKTAVLQIDNMRVFAKQLEVMRQNANKLEDNIEDRIFKYIVDAAIKFDDDGNDELSDDEAANVISQIRDFFHVSVDSAKFMEVVQKNRSVGGIIQSFRRRHASGDSAMQIFKVGEIN
eukprot:CAMPEP_0194283268 /NCGR_PEP_ID=MMETSP0169-20130528/25000_1 /TAXON_ID=218684 /ORGANISM="Corethron pennatum, Strain L29A3" /LENGTH=259 /DNA_ID=CAMNT_0039028833 /DNA_START=54 /DNA_END=833 /DNA_ORIENTATION=-